MRGKRSKQYRKLMHQYELSFNFRVPYQVLVDAEMIQDTTRFKMNLPLFLERTLHGQVKPMITQCSIRHLYTADGPDAATKNAWIDTAKSFERRRCNHHTLPEPLSTLECITSVVDSKGSGTNKHRYVVASQDQKVRSAMRNITGVPLVYVNRSVMVMEPMAAKTEDFREAEEMGKVRAGLKGRRGPAPEPNLKRKRSDEDEDEDETPEDAPATDAADSEAAPKKRAKKGPKGPNPLSVKKSKKRSAQEEQEKQAIRKAAKSDPQAAEKAVDADVAISSTANDQSEASGKKKRRRKHKSAADAAVDHVDGGDAAADVDVEA